MYTLDDFDFDLPKDCIAQHPAEKRSMSKLMVLDQGMEHRRFKELVLYLRKGDLFLLNDTKVFPARLIGRKETGGKLEVLLIKPLADEEGGRKVEWEAFLSGKKIRPGLRFQLFGGDMNGECLDQIKGGRFIVRLVANKPIMEIVYDKGKAPTPPYIKTKDVSREKYQTVFARHEGSIAAPTAGLHFDRGLLDRVRALGVEVGYITLHVGPGTFMGVKTKDISRHDMESESYSIPPTTVDKYHRAVDDGARIFCVGTTVMRAMESATSSKGKIIRTKGEAEIFIYPPYRFKSKIDALITNFHIPKSTLIMLVTAFGGYDRIMRAYQEAVESGYRFYSFGDAMLIFGGGR